MYPLFFISNKPYSGKSSICVGVGKKLIDDGFKVGYMKPVGTLPVKEGNITTDEDARYIAGILNLKDDLQSITPIVMTQQSIIESLRDIAFSQGFLDLVGKAYQKIKQDKNLVIVEGAKSVEDGYFMGVSSREICRRIGAKAVMVMRFCPEIVDQILYAREFLDDCFGGVIINWVPKDQVGFLEEMVLPFLNSKQVKVFGYIQSNKILSSVSVKEMARQLEGKIICAEDKTDELVESFMVGAMGQEQALKFFRKKANKAVITGGDRADVQLAALETPTKCLILTGNFQPSTIVLGRAEELGIPMILVNYDTLTAVEKVEKIIGHVRFHDVKKIDKMVEVAEECIDTEALINLAKG